MALESLREPASWVIVERATGKAIMELQTTNKELLAKVNKDKYDVVDILTYLGSINGAH